MFRDVLRMELKRCCSFGRVAVAVSVIVIIFLLSAWKDFGISAIVHSFPERSEYIGSGDILQSILVMNRYTVICVFILGWLHAGSFSRDDTYQYLRMVLSRTDVTTYTQCRFLSNMLAVCVVSMLSFYLFVLLLAPYMDIFIESRIVTLNPYYAQLALDMPLPFIGMMGFQFGMIVTAFSSIGLLYSVYQPNYFVSIAMGGMVFYASTSFMDSFFTGKRFGAFDVWGMIMMDPVLGDIFPCGINYLWGVLFSLTIVLICGCLFYRRMRWRLVNGYI